MQEQQRKILVTCALPYANGHIHIGHMVEHIQADIWVRALRMQGHEVHFVCADDAHGTPIMVNAQKRGITPEELIGQMRGAHEADFSDFSIAYDNYSTTHSDKNRELVGKIWQSLVEKNLVSRRTISQFFDPKEEMFLPDRFIKGACPKCGAEDQYGDSCEVCGSTYDPTDLKNPFSVVSGETPVMRDTEHLFVELGKLESTLQDWVNGGQLQSEVVNKLKEWFEAGLRDWDVTRDKPYFGFQIPGEQDKFFYVWVDAPVGYMASFAELCERENIDFDAYWKDDGAEIYHFIGKDIVYFHTLFWPAMLHAAGFNKPASVFVHGFLTVDGTKMSKTRGTFIQARTYLEHLKPDYLRYYLASKLGSGLSDIDLNLEDFQARVNSDLVGKVVNIASRCAGFIGKRFDGKLADKMAEPELFERLSVAGDGIAADFEAREYNRAIRQIMALADEANRFVDSKKPWLMIKEEGRGEEVHQVCTTGINLFRLLAIYLKPVIPDTVGRAEEFLNVPALSWADGKQPLLAHEISTFKPLMTRIEEKDIQAMVEASKETMASSKEAPAKPAGPLAEDPISEEIDFETFSKIDLRVARIADADFVDGADKLLRLQLDLGGERKQVFAGIKSAYTPTDLVGRMTVMVANLAPRKMRFGMSEGMVLAAGPGGDELYILSPDDGAKPGMRVK